jgi:hypothetical protein
MQIHKVWQIAIKLSKQVHYIKQVAKHYNVLLVCRYTKFVQQLAIKLSKVLNKPPSGSADSTHILWSSSSIYDLMFVYEASGVPASFRKAQDWQNDLQKHWLSFQSRNEDRSCPLVVQNSKHNIWQILYLFRSYKIYIYNKMKIFLCQIYK